MPIPKPIPDAQIRSKASPLIFNLGSGSGFSVREIIDVAGRVTGRKIPVVEAPRRPGDSAVLIASSEKIKRELGWRPQHSDIEAIVRSAWEWHRLHTSTLK